MARPYTGSHLSTTFFVGVTIAAYLIAPIRTCPVNCTCTADPFMVVICNGQDFTEIPENIPKNTVTLSLSYNKIPILDLHTLYGLELLERVDFSSNKIKTIYGSFESFKNLYIIDLSHNNIEVIPWKTFGNLSQINLFKLTGNPFNCDCNQWDTELCDCGGDIFRCTCNMQWLQAQVQKYPTLSWDVTCENPAEARGKAIQEVTFMPHGCETKYQKIVGGAVAGFVFIVAIVGLTILCRSNRSQFLCSCWKTGPQGARRDDSYDYTCINNQSPGERLSQSSSLGVPGDGDGEATIGDNVGSNGPVQLDDVEEESTNPKAKRDEISEHAAENGQPKAYAPGPSKADTSTQDKNTMEHRPISQRLLPEIATKIVTDIQLLKLAENLGLEWEGFAIHLGFKKANVDIFKVDNPYNTKIQIVEMLVAWKEEQGASATVENLVKELEAFGIDVEKFEFFLESS